MSIKRDINHPTTVPFHHHDRSRVKRKTASGSKVRIWCEVRIWCVHPSTRNHGSTQGFYWCRLHVFPHISLGGMGWMGWMGWIWDGQFTPFVVSANAWLPLRVISCLDVTKFPTTYTSWYQGISYPHTHQRLKFQNYLCVYPYQKQD